MSKRVAKGLTSETYEEYVAIDVLGAATYRLKSPKAGTAGRNTEVH
jgi:hypothetical protein